MSTPERRRYPRSPFNRPGRLRVGTGPDTHAQFMTISPFGASLFYARPLDLQTDVEVSFRLNLNPTAAELTLHGRVQDCFLNDGSAYIRVRFVDPPLQAVETIHKYIRHAGAQLRVS